ncbi:MAG: hypothetical protein GXO31_05805 [Epsilonproteobacteria bacterium]|nr:hypothetical protein [Campylobacterota bacterium]
MKRKLLFLFFISLFFSIGVFSKEIGLDNNLTRYETQNSSIQTIKTPFSIVLDDRLNAIKIDLGDKESIRLTISKKDSKEGEVEIISYKDGSIVSDESVNENNFDREFDSKDVDEVVLKAKGGEFKVKAAKFEIIADMEFNIPDETSIQSVQDEQESKEAKSEDEEIVEEVISASDEEAFKKATGEAVEIVEAVEKSEDNGSLNLKEEENKIELAYDETADKKEFEKNLKKELREDESLKETPEVPVDLSKEESKVDTKLALANPPKPNMEEIESKIKKPLNLKEEEPSLQPKDLQTKGFDESLAKSEDIGENSLKEDLKKEELNLKEPQISSLDVEKGIDRESLVDKKSDLKSVISKEEIRSPKMEALQIDKEISQSAALSAPKIKESEISLNRPNLSDETLKIKEENVGEKPQISSFSDQDLKKGGVSEKIAINDKIKSESFESSKPNIASFSDKEIKRAGVDSEIAATSIKNEALDSKKPVIKESKLIAKPAIEPKSGSLNEQKGSFEAKPSIAKEAGMMAPPVIASIKSPKTSSSLKEIKPSVEVEDKIVLNAPKNLPSDTEGVLDVYVLKDGKKTVGWIDIIDEKSGKVVATGDTFYKNPASFKLPIGKYTVVITDKKVVPPLVEKISSIEVRGGEKSVARSTFANGVLKIAVLKNSSPTSTAYVKVYDAKTDRKVVDDNTYRNNPVTVRLPFGKYYVVIEDYSLTPKQRIVLKDINITSKDTLLKTVNFKEGKLRISTFKNNMPIGARYEIFRAGSTKKIKSGFTDRNSGDAEMKLAAGLYDVRVSHRNSVSKTIKKFKNVEISKDSVKELNVIFREGKLRVISKRGLNPLYTNVSIYKPGSKKRLYFDFTSRENGEVVIELPVGVYTIVVRDHNIKRVFPRVRIRDNKTYTIHAKF